MKETAERATAAGIALTTSLEFGHPAQVFGDIQARTGLVVLGRQGEHAGAEILEQGGEFIVYDYGAPYSDMITIQSAPIPGEELVNASDDALQDIVLQLHKGRPGYDGRDYFVRARTAGRRH